MTAPTHEKASPTSTAAPPPWASAGSSKPPSDQRRRLLITLAIAAALGIVAIGVAARLALHNGDLGVDETEPAVSENAPTDEPAGSDAEGVAEEADPEESIFESGVPEAVPALPAAVPGSLAAYASSSHEFATRVHNAANGVISGTSPAALMNDQARILLRELAELTDAAQQIPGTEQILRANQQYGPIIGQFGEGSGSPSDLRALLQEASRLWLESAADSAPELKLTLPPIVAPIRPTLATPESPN